MPVFPFRMDLTNLGANQGFVIQGDNAGDRAGYSVASAGDVNGDGIDDLIIGMRDADSGNFVGEAYIVFGTRDGFGAPVGGRRVVDLATLSAGQGVVLRGDSLGDLAGFSVAAAGDVNGDGIDDIIIGAPGDDANGTDAGAAYVVFGTRAGFGTDVGGRQVLDIASLAAWTWPGDAQGFTLRGGNAGDQAGRSVSAAGDVNGDGIDDLMVGAAGGDGAGQAYVVFGMRDPPGYNPGSGQWIVTLTGLYFQTGVIIRGSTAGDGLGLSMAPAGDVNGDGIGDMIFGASGADAGGDGAGEAYVVFGTRAGFGEVAFVREIDVSILSATQGFVIRGDAAFDAAAVSVSSAGDVNGDGIDDIIIGASGGDDGGSAAGEAYIVFGTRAGFGTDVGGRQVIDLTALTASQGFVVQGAAAGDGAGIAVSAAGDINADGIGDLIVGAAGNGGGAAYVLYGTRAGFGADVGGRHVVDLASLTAGQGFIIDGDSDGDQAGRSVSAAGDVNGDGVDDLIVGARYGDDGGNDAGEAYVIFGIPAKTDNPLPPTIDLTTLSASDGFAIFGGASGDSFGNNVRFAGDVNGDGFDDLIVSAPTKDRAGSGDPDGLDNSGVVYVIFGKASGFGTIDLAGPLAAEDGFEILGANRESLDSVSSAGDFNGDGFDDLLIGARSNSNAGPGAGAAYVIFGKASGFGTIDLADPLAAADGFMIQGEPGDAGGGGGSPSSFGASVAAAGDLDDDGLADIVVSAPFMNAPGKIDAGAIYVIYGRVAGFGTINLAALGPGERVVMTTGQAAQDRFGVSVSGGGDINGDGIDDLMAGAPRHEFFSLNNHGTAYILAGRAGGGGFSLNDAPLAAHGTLVHGAAPNNELGVVSAAGDINGDGFGDFIVGAPLANAAYVIFGAGSGLFGSPVALFALDPVQGFKIQGSAPGDRAGISLSAAGDFDGDGFDDLIVGASENDVGGTDAGAAYIIFGKASGFGTIDLAALTADQGIRILGGASDQAGNSLSGGGDVNGDGFADIIVGARGVDVHGFASGAAYVIFGRSRLVFNAPVLDLDGGAAPIDNSASYNEQAAPVLLAAGLAIGDVDDTDIESASVRISSGFLAQHDLLTVNGASGPGTISGIDYSWNAATGILTLIGHATLATYQSVLRQVGFESSSDTPGTARTITWTVNDGTAESMAAQTLLTVNPVNDPLALGANAGLTVNEGATGTVTTASLAYTDIDSSAAQIVYTITAATNGALRLSGNALGLGDTFTQADIDGGRIAFRHDGSETTSASFGFSVSDGATIIAGQTFSFIVIPVDDAPVLAANAGLTVVEGATGTVTSALLDYDDANYVDSAITYRVTSAATNGILRRSGVTLNLNDTFTQADINGGLITYAHDGGETISASFGFSVSNIEATVGSQSFLFTVTPVNDAPALGVNNPLTMAEGGTGTITAADLGYSDADNSAAQLVYTITSAATNGALRLNGGALGLGASFTQADINAGLVTYVHDGGETTSASFGFSLSDGQATIAGQSFAFTVTLLDDPAVAANDTGIVTNENATVNIAVLANDSDPDGPMPSVAMVDGTAIAVGAPVTLASGAIVSLNANGTLTYNPNGRFNTLVVTGHGAANATAPDNFTYSLAGPGGGVATVGVTVNGVASIQDRYEGDSGNNVITGTPNGDLFDLSQGGDDTVTGLGASDGFFFGAAFTAADRVDGGAGTNDQIGLQGNYTGGNALTLGANTIANIEVIAVLPGFSYNITTVDGNVPAGGLLKVQATLLAAGQSLTFNGAAETNGSFIIYGGQGNDTFTGGGGNDGFYFGPGGFTSGDTVDGGAGANDQLALDGSYGGFGPAFVLGGNVTNVEVLVLLPGPSGSPNTFNLTTNEAFVPTGTTMTIFGLQVTTDIVFDGSHELDGAFKIYGGGGNDTVIGGSGNDWIFGGNGADGLSGGLGNDIFYYDAVAQSTAANGDIIFDFAAGDRIDVSGIDAISGGGDDAFAFLGASAFTSHAGELRVENQGGATWLVEADVNGDGVADFQLTLITGDAHPITTTDFVL